MPSILGKIHWLVTNITPSEICAGDYLTQLLSATLAQMSRGILVSLIASIDLLFIIFSRKLAEYAHIWLRSIIEIVTLPAIFPKHQVNDFAFVNHQTLNVAPYRRNALGPAWNWDLS